MHSEIASIQLCLKSSIWGRCGVSRDSLFTFTNPLHHRDFHVVRDGGRLLGRLAAKPLYGRLTSDGKVDRSAGFNGQVAVIFIPARARTPSAAKLLITKMPRRHVTKADGRRNWEAIYTAAENAVRKSFGAH
jgi:hypothetical protein